MLTEYDRKIRKGRITGTRIGGVVGLSKYKTPIDVWRALVEPEGVDEGSIEDSPDVQRGKYLEAGMLEWFAHVTGAVVHHQDAAVHPVDNRFAATPDGWAKMPDGSIVNLEVKMPRRGDDWGESGTDDIPTCHVCQVVQEMGVFGRKLTKMIALVWGEMRIYDVPHDPELEAILLNRGGDFYDKYVMTRIPPPPDSSDNYYKYLKHIFPGMAKGEMLPTTEDLDAKVARYLAAKERADEVDDEIKLLKNQICAEIGDAKGIKGGDWKAVWNNVRGRQKTDWKAYVNDLGGTPEGADKYTTRGAGYRAFSIKRI